jgi:tyrosine-protein kinase Etk/Wzc
VTTDAEITESIKRLNYAGLSPQGILFNDMTYGIGRYSAFQQANPTGQLAYSA